jgi:sugar porter (SP) family MFS transporter
MGSATNTNRFVYVAAAIAAINGALFGYDTGIISGALLYIKKDFALSNFLQELVVSGVLVGAVLGAAVGGRLADRLGRRRIILITAAIFVVGAVGMGLSPGVWWLIIFRFVAGIGIGIASIVGPLYISETAPPQIRGSVVSFNQLAITSGILIAYLVGFALSFSGGWRLMVGLGAVPALVLGLGMLFMPESPRWLVARGEEEKAREVLGRIDDSIDHDEGIQSIRQAISQESGGASELLKEWLRPALVVGIGLAVLQQITGVNTVIYYAPTIFQATGFGGSASILGTVGVGVVNVLLTVAAILLVDRVGRRLLLLIGLAGMVASLGVLGLAFLLPALSGIVGWIAIVSLALYIAFFAVGLGPVFWLLISEIYPQEVRGAAMSVASVGNWASNLLVSLTFLSLVGAIGRPFTFWLYALVGVAAIVFVYFLAPETKGRSLEDIQQLWIKRSGKTNNR